MHEGKVSPTQDSEVKYVFWLLLGGQLVSFNSEPVCGGFAFSTFFNRTLEKEMLPHGLMLTITCGTPGGS